MKQMKGYANLTNDYMFKRVFGSEECKDKNSQKMIYDYENTIDFAKTDE